MSTIKTEDISGISFTSTVFPTEEDRALWESLSDEQRQALIVQSEKSAYESGVSDKASLQELLSETRAEL
ncbi:MAG: hypothetical protein O3A84_09420 [Proteobacteria bacterium]|nr:hypothetical protein [Pseudomonadota bacterium]